MSTARSFFGLFLQSAAGLIWAVTLAGCGSSVNTSTSPSTFSKCAVAFDAPAAPLPAGGGTGAIPVKAERECPWTAEASDAWLSITAGRSGQGNGTVEFAVAPNNDPVARTGVIMLNGSRAQVAQGASECRYTLAASSASFGQGGGTGGVDVAASSPLCTWTAASNTEWISVTSGATGKGSAAVSFSVAPTAGPPRTGSLTIAGLPFEVTQSEGCVYTIAPPTFAAGAAGGTGAVTVTAAAGCPWTASNSVSWITLATTSGIGTGTAGFTVAPTTGPTRSGTLTIAGQPFTVTQSPGCGYDVSPLNHTVDAAGGTRTVNVAAAAGCVWTASSNAPWITITGGASGSGAGAVTFAAAATTGPSRTGTLVVGGQTVTVVQSQGCTFAISPQTQSLPASGGDGSVSVTAGSGCAWTAASGAPWITIVSGASGSGNGSVSFRAAATNGPARTGTLTIAGRTFTLNQGADCTIALSSTSATQPAAGGTGTFDVRTAQGCGWTSASNAPWLTVTAGGSGEGNGTVRYSAAGNTGPSRTGTISAGGHTFTVSQEAGCAFSISPATHNADSGGGNRTVAVTTAAGCAWSASSNAPWIGISSGGSGSGPGAVLLVIAANTGAERQGTVTIAGQTFTAQQASGCSYSISPRDQTLPSAGGSGSFSVSTAGGCAWTAAANAPWLSVTSGGNGTGPGTVQFTAAANTGGGRSGTITAGGQTFTVTQGAACNPVVSPETIAAPAAGGSENVSVMTAAECPWTAVSNAGWIAITAGATGSGNGTVQLDVQPNTGPARNGTATIAGRTVGITQAAGCNPVVSPETIAAAAAGGPQNVSVTAAAECPWTAVSNAAWVAITTGAAGSGNGTVQLDVQPNTGPARNGTATIAGRTVAITQEGGCTFSIAPPTQAAAAAGGSGTVTVTAGAGCTWTAVSNATWITVTKGGTGSGAGTVEFTIDPNATAAPRTGTITIGGQTFTVDQAGV